MTDAELNEWFDKADLNKDGVISVEEAAIFVDKYFLHHGNWSKPNKYHRFLYN